MQQPDMAPFSPAGGWEAAEAPSPISSRPPEPGQQLLDELGGASGSGSQKHEGLAGEEGKRGGSSASNRWPRQETLALLKIRSGMDAAFRDAALKGPLWEEVSRRLAQMGYRRSAKKCREKFENVDKYYKRTKDGRGDGKAYRFFSELEALHGAASAHQPPLSLAPTPVAVAPPVTTAGASGPSAARVYTEPPPPLVPQSACEMTMGDVSFSLGSDGEDTDDTAGGGKRKRPSGSGDGEAMRFFEGLMLQVMERQEAMQQRLLVAIERREQDRMIRGEAWRRQEVARLARQQDALAQERAMAASRDAAVISFIQRVTGQTIPLAGITSLISPPLRPTPVASASPAPPPSQHQQTPPVHQHKPDIMPMAPHPQQPHAQSKEVVRAPPESPDTAGCRGGGASSSRWPKAEVHALIQLRTELETRYQEARPKGPLWEDISAGMRPLGYNRSAKRCKEKWENINKYFKRVKESNKKRPEDSKTCPYYHRLEALYRSKALASSGTVNASPRPEAAVTIIAAVPLSQTAPAHAEHGGKNCSDGNGNECASRDNGISSGGMQMKASNGSVAPGFSVEGAAAAGNGMATNSLGLKQEGVVATTAEQRQQPVAVNNDYSNDRMDDMDSDSMDDDDVGGGKMLVQYDIHFQRRQQQQNQNVVRPNASGGGGNPPATGPAAPAGTAAATSGPPFLAMVQ